jgi:hypothetical protein
MRRAFVPDRDQTGDRALIGTVRSLTGVVRCTPDPRWLDVAIAGAALAGIAATTLPLAIGGALMAVFALGRLAGVAAARRGEERPASAPHAMQVESLSMAIALLFGVFALLLLLGVPVAFALAASAFATTAYLGLPALVTGDRDRVGRQRQHPDRHSAVHPHRRDHAARRPVGPPHRFCRQPGRPPARRPGSGQRRSPRCCSAASPARRSPTYRRSAAP